MARTLQTARKSTRPIPSAVRLDRDYQRRWIHRDELLREFISLFSDLWARAHPHGVTGYDGIVRLIHHLPGGWRDWAIALAPHFITRAYPAFDLVGDALGFFAAVHTACIRFDHVPPPVTYMPFDAPAEDLPPWTFPGQWDQTEYEGKSSRPPTEKRARTETQTTRMRQVQLDPTSIETQTGEAARKGKEPTLDEDLEDHEDSEEDSESEEDLEMAELDDDLETTELAEDLEMTEPLIAEAETPVSECAPPLPVGPPPEIPPSPTESGLGDPSLLHPADWVFYSELCERMARSTDPQTELSRLPVAPEAPERIFVAVVSEEQLSPIRAEGPTAEPDGVQQVSSDSEPEEEPQEAEGGATAQTIIWILDD